MTVGACALVQTQALGFGASSVLLWLNAVLWAGALTVLALGIRGEGSVVARRPLGVIALLIAGVVPLVAMFVRLFAPVTYVPQGSDLGVSMAVSYVVWLPVAALLIAMVVIARAGAVPHRWRWYPAIVLAAVVGVNLVAQLAGLAAPTAGQQVLLPFFAITTLVAVAAPVALGIPTIVRAGHRAPAPADAAAHPPVG